ncbi:MAG TPA: hypothetical protein VJ842_19765 [Pyrinomonadaceae bacterium]|nr:hypothetical protein [Pyrinomonadaceae bacterium]
MLVFRNLNLALYPKLIPSSEFANSRVALKQSKYLRVALVAVCLNLICAGRVAGQRAAKTRDASRNSQLSQNAARDRAIASHFAPVFYQGLGDKKIQDYITNFDFDGDWRGDNNWVNAEDDTRFARRAYVYYAVSETPTHFLVHYAVFHPRDYKGGQARGAILSQIIREGARRGGRYDPTGLSGEAVLAHENDMEGCLVVATKAGADFKQARVVFVETLAHDRFNKYVTEAAAAAEGNKSAFDMVRIESGRPLLYVEPKGHGIYAYDAGEKQTPPDKLLVYKFAGRADDPLKSSGNEIGYELLPLATTIWPRARAGVNQTFGAAYNYGKYTFSAAQTSTRATKRVVTIGTLGAAFRGNKGAPNMARPPWGWFDRSDAGQLHGEWFFDPAATVKRHFKLDDTFSVAYTHAPFLSLVRKL